MKLNMKLNMIVISILYDSNFDIIDMLLLILSDKNGAFMRDCVNIS